MFLNLIKVLTFLITVFQVNPEYALDIIEIDWNITTKDKLEVQLEVSRISRGVFGVSGIVEFKEDIDTDHTWETVKIDYSPNGISYVLSPYHIPRNVFTNSINFGYKVYLMEDLKTCAENYLYFKDKFVSPITKRRVKYRNCTISTDTFPSHMRKGFYKIKVFTTGEMENTASLLIYLEPV